MFFTVIEAPAPQNAPPETAFLIVDNWNDWFTYRTMFTLVVVDAAGEHHQPGSVKIGQRGMRGWKHIENGVAGQGAPELPQTFDALGDQFFSLGQDETYYETLNRLPDALKLRVLEGLKDVAHDLDLFEQVRTEDVFRQSLLRYMQESHVRGRFNRLTRGDARLTEFHFTYALPAVGDEPSQMRH